MSSSKFDALEQCVVIGKDGRMGRLRVSFDDLGIRDDLLLKAAGEAAGVPLYNVCDMPNTEPPMKIHVYAAAAIGMAVRLTKVRLNTWWTMVEQDGEPVLVPSFHESGSIDRSLDWIPPSDCALYLVVRNSTAYFVALGVHPERGHWRAIRLDLPNIFSDAKVCMGRNFSSPDTGSYVSRLRGYLDSIHSSRWNMDLIQGDAGSGDRASTSKELVRFSLDGKCLPPLKPWYKLGGEVSHSSYNWLVGMAQARKEAP